jgi:hypothetical protein
VKAIEKVCVCGHKLSKHDERTFHCHAKRMLRGRNTRSIPGCDCTMFTESDASVAHRRPTYREHVTASRKFRNAVKKGHSW